MINKLVVALGLLLASSVLAHADCERPFIFFDLGQTIVDTDTYKFEKIMYMPGAFDYIRELKARGYPLGLIVNIPESWGANRQEKLATLRKFVEDRWTDPNPIAWRAFDLGILIPMNNSERKPAPVLFEAAVRMAAEAGCPAIYEGEEAPEVAAASAAGMKAFQAGSVPGFYLPIEKIDEFARKLRR